jgi:hypothetical protein
MVLLEIALRGGSRSASDVRGECTRLPSNPIAADHAMSVTRCVRRSWDGHIGKPNAHITPIRTPPAVEAIRPSGLIPPFVPGGTVFIVVISTGCRLDNIPNSDAHVSAVAAA